MKLITYLLGQGYERYAEGHANNGVEVHNAPAVHPKLGKISAIANVSEDTVGPIVFLDADVVLIRGLTEKDFADIPAGTEIAGVAMLPPWSKCLLPDTFSPWQTTVEIPALNSGFLWFPDAATARLIGAAWLAHATAMYFTLDYLRDEIVLARTLQDLSSAVYEIPDTKGLNISVLSPGVVAWHDIRKELPETGQAAWMAAKLAR